MVAFNKLTKDEQEVKIAGDSLKEAEDEMGHKIGFTKDGK